MNPERSCVPLINDNVVVYINVTTIEMDTLLKDPGPDNYDGDPVCTYCRKEDG